MHCKNIRCFYLLSVELQLYLFIYCTCYKGLVLLFRSMLCEWAWYHWPLRLSWSLILFFTPSLARLFLSNPSVSLFHSLNLILSSLSVELTLFLLHLNSSSSHSWPSWHPGVSRLFKLIISDGTLWLYEIQARQIMYINKWTSKATRCHRWCWKTEYE